MSMERQRLKLKCLSVSKLFLQNNIERRLHRVKVTSVTDRTKSTLPVAEKPAFSQHLKDTGVVTGHPVTLSCKVSRPGKGLEAVLNIFSLTLKSAS